MFEEFGESHDEEIVGCNSDIGFRLGRNQLRVSQPPVHIGGTGEQPGVCEKDLQRARKKPEARAKSEVKET
jgi:hypothetical protein